jgi:hypothetical protein
MRRKFVVAAMVALGALLGWWARGFLAVDACLDVGGRWEQRGGFCDGARPVQD